MRHFRVFQSLYKISKTNFLLSYQLRIQQTLYDQDKISIEEVIGVTHHPYRNFVVTVHVKTDTNDTTKITNLPNI